MKKQFVLIMFLCGTVLFATDIIKFPVGASTDLDVGTVVKIAGGDTIAACVEGDEPVGVIMSYEGSGTSREYLVGSAGVVPNVLCGSAITAGDKLVPAAAGAVQPLSSDSDGHIVGFALESGASGARIKIMVSIAATGGAGANQTITTGAGVIGAESGTSGDLTIDVGAGWGISTSATQVSVNQTTLDGRYLDNTDDQNLSFTGTASPYTLDIEGGSDVTFAQGSGITLSRSSDQLTITNASPDQTVSLTGGTNISVSGSYPNFTIDVSPQGSGSNLDADLLDGHHWGDIPSLPPNNVTGSGTATQVAYWDGSNTITGESNLYWDSSNDRLGIGTSSPCAKLEVNGVIKNNNNIHFGTNAASSSWEVATELNDGIEVQTPASGDRMVHIIVDNANVLTCTQSEDVGIGTTSPGEKLSVSGRISLTTDPNSADDVGDRGYNDGRYINDGVGEVNTSSDFNFTSNTWIDNLDADLLDGHHWSEIPSLPSNNVTGSGTATQVAYWDGSNTITGESNLYWDSSNDRLGIGTSSPSYTLDVDGYLRVNSTSDPGRDYRIQCTSRQNIYANNDLVENIDGNKVVIVGVTGPNNDFYISSALEGSKFFTAEGTNQRIGIGTTSPVDKLDVNGRTYTNGLTDDGTLDQNGSADFSTTVDIHGTLDMNGQNITNVESIYLDHIYHDDINPFMVHGNMEITGALHDGSGYGSSGQLLATNGSSDIYWTNSLPGGDNSYIQNQTASDQSASFRISGNGYIGGNVGIGTTTPSTKLHVQTSSGGEIARFSSYSYSGPTAVIGTENSAPGLGYLELYYATEGTPRVKITAHSSNPSYFNGGGNVGIGTTSPSAKLHVVPGSNVGVLVDNYSGTSSSNGGVKVTFSGASSSARGVYADWVGSGSHDVHAGHFDGYTADNYGYGVYGIGGWYGGYFKITGNSGSAALKAYVSSSSSYADGLSASTYGSGEAVYAYSSGAVDQAIYSSKSVPSGRQYTQSVYAYTYYSSGSGDNTDSLTCGVYGRTDNGDSYYMYTGAGAIGMGDYSNDATGGTGVYGRGKWGMYAEGSYDDYGRARPTSGGEHTSFGVGILAHGASGAAAWGTKYGGVFLSKELGIYAGSTDESNSAAFFEGNVMTTSSYVQLNKVDGEHRFIPTYSATSTEQKIYADGVAELSLGTARVEFDANFRKLIDGDLPVTVTVTPMGSCGGLYLSDVDANGFTVVENGRGSSNIRFSWIAIGRKSEPVVPAKYLANDYGNETFRSIFPESYGFKDKNDPLFYSETPLSSECPSGQTPEAHRARIEKERNESKIMTGNAINVDKYDKNGGLER